MPSSNDGFLLVMLLFCRHADKNLFLVDEKHIFEFFIAPFQAFQQQAQELVALETIVLQTLGELKLQYCTRCVTV